MQIPPFASTTQSVVESIGVVIERMAGKPVVALAAVMQTSPMVWVVRADANIFTPQDLAGKRLMLMPPPESSELLAMLLQEGIRLEDVTLLPTSLDINSLIKGEADAYDGYSGNEPYTLAEQGVDYRLIRPGDYGVNFYNDVLITREDLLAQKPAEVEAFVRATLRGWDYALSNIDETVDLIQQKYATGKSRHHLMFEALELKSLIMPELVELGHMNPARWNAIAESYVTLGLAQGPVDLDGFLYTGANGQDLTWFYRIFIPLVLGFLIVSLVTMRFARLNRRLLREAAAGVVRSF